MYDYYPNREALLSSYVRMQLERMLERLGQDVVAAPDVAWQERVRRLIRICCEEDAARGAPFFDAGLFQLEMQISEPWHQRRGFDERSAKWREAIAACPDLPHQPSPETVDALFTAVWGGRRYCITAQFEPVRIESWLRQMEVLCYCLALDAVEPCLGAHTRWPAVVLSAPSNKMSGTCSESTTIWLQRTEGRSSPRPVL